MKQVHVVAAVIRRDDGCILIARRPAHVHQGGLWEFPGGKVEAGESVTDALSRELNEELGIVPRIFRPLIRIPHRYPDKSVLLDVWLVSAFSGEPSGREGQPVVWCAADALCQYDFPAANAPILGAARLPSRIWITPENLADRLLLEALGRVLDQGISMVHLRAPGLDEGAFCRRALLLQASMVPYGARLILGGHAHRVDELGGQGVHVPARDLATLQERPVTKGLWFGASCHNAGELSLAVQVGADYAYLSPVRHTLTHPGQASLGWARFRQLVEPVPIPVYGLGGLSGADLGDAWDNGAQGVAAIRGFQS